MKKLRNFLILFVAIGLIGMFAHADEIHLSPDDSLHAAISGAASGDVFILEGGETYNLAENANIDGAVITIKAEEGATERPEIVMSGGLIRFFNSGGGLTFKGVNARGDGQNYFITFDPSFGAAKHIKIYDAKVTDFPRSAIREDGPEAGAKVDTLIIENSEFYNFDDDGYRFVHFGDIIGFDYFKMVNSTVSDFSESFLWSETPTRKTVIVKNCTFEGMVSPYPSFFGLTSPGGSVEIENIIMANLESNDNSIFGLTGFAQTTLLNSRYYEVGSTEYNWTTVENFEEAEPNFADPDNYDFTLPESSPLLTAGTEGGPIGDPRWAGTVAIKEEASLPNKYALGQNYPNPFNPITTIEFTLKKAVDTKLNVYNITGKLVETLVNKEMKQGRHSVRFNASQLPAGMYFYRLESGNFSKVKKMILLK